MRPAVPAGLSIFYVDIAAMLIVRHAASGIWLANAGRILRIKQVPKLAEAQVPSQVQGEQWLVLKRALEESFVRSFRLAMLVSAGGPGERICAWLTNGSRRMGWKETTTQQLTGADDGPIETKDVSAIDIIRARISGASARLGMGSDSGEPE